MELMAALVALKETSGTPKPIILHSDSSYLVNGITKGWAKSWRRNGWRKSDGKEALNRDLWESLLNTIKDQKVEFRWVKGHAGDPLNERCDQLAVESARGSELSVDQGYE
jgi:ribonuclease HI